jgi:hypothetical protein
MGTGGKRCGNGQRAVAAAEVGVPLTEIMKNLPLLGKSGKAVGALYLLISSLHIHFGSKYLNI